MQLLTASKLSTVAMLAMAAVLHFSVSAVPMEKSDAVVEVVPVDLSVYKPSESGKPSPKSYEDLLDIIATVPDLNEQKPSGSSDPSASPDQLQHRAKILIDKLDNAWDKYKGVISEDGDSERDYTEFTAVTPVWEKILEEINGQESLKDCSYDLLPYTPDKRFGKSKLQEDQMLQLFGSIRGNSGPYVTNNICRLAVNGAYPWLLRLHTKNNYIIENQIYTVLGQLRLFTTDKDEAIKLDKLLKLFTFISRAGGRKAYVPSAFKPLLMAAMPEVIPALNISPADITRVILLHAAKERQLRTSTPIVVGGKPLEGVIKTDGMTVFLNNLERILEKSPGLSDYSATLEYQFFETCDSLPKTLSEAINDILNDPFSGYKVDGKTIEQSYLLSKYESTINLFEVLANSLDLPQFINLYNRVPQDRRDISLIVMAGRSRIGPDAMFHVFEDILGEPGTPIKDGVQVNGRSLTAKHLAQLVQDCALVCTEDNWNLFVDELLDRLKVTEHLPSGDKEELNNVKAEEQLPGSDDKVDKPTPSPAEKVALKITPFINSLSQRFKNFSPISPAVRSSVKESFPKVVERMNAAIEELNTSHYSKTNVKGAHRE